MRFHHIGIATDDIDRMKGYLGRVSEVGDVSGTVYDELQDAELCMVSLEDGTQIELIAGRVVEKLVKKRNFLYHICYEVDDLEGQMENLVENGAIVVSDPKEAVLFQGRRVAFLMTDMGMVELLEVV